MFSVKGKGLIDHKGQEQKQEDQLEAIKIV